ncbi:TonB-dependent receptor [Undibacterium sp.]|uniref:TonB-dependent receptor n=1 Tax=Undibacterium sp. TaxID=1914977 RepID=UPI003751495B
MNTSKLFARSPLACACFLLFSNPHNTVFAQSQNTDTQRVEVTGSAIKRMNSQSALPVQVISRDEIDANGSTTAAEIMAKVVGNIGALTDGVSLNTGGDQRGFNSVNLRGLGSSSTLILLNGRRLSNFASPGDDAGVDLNNIPAAAIQKVEILLDGASALYGADAIAGVVNFITRKDFRGAEISTNIVQTFEGGAAKRTFTLSGGLGNLERDAYNVFAVLDAQRNGSLFAADREFINDLKVPERLGHLLSGLSNPANIRLTARQLDHLRKQNFTINGKAISNRVINFSAPDCNAPANINLPKGTAGPDGCTYNYMNDTALIPKSEKVNLLSRAVFQIAPQQQVYAELNLGKATTHYVTSPTRVNATIDYKLVPQLANTGLNTVKDPIPGQLSLRMRLSEAGNRTNEVISEGQRILLGMTGKFDLWDYDVALGQSANTARDFDKRGYVLSDKLLAGIADGTINAFGPSSAAGKALYESIQVDDESRYARSTMSSLDFKASRPIMAMDGGDMSLAVGAELRRESSVFRPSALLKSNNINNDPAPEDCRNTRDARNIQGVFAELHAPFAEGWEAQFAVRHDQYQKVGGATSPKLGLLYQASPDLLFRGSAASGFRAPSMSDLYRPTIVSSTATLPDPKICASNNNDLTTCADNWTTRRFSNAKLQPERSQQFTLGSIVEVGSHWTVGLDYWHIQRSQVISEIGDDLILSNLAKYGDLVKRSSDGRITSIELRKDNRGSQKSSGVDLNIDLHKVQSVFGVWGAHLQGTYMLKSKQQMNQGDAYISNLGKFVTEGAVPKWRHNLTLMWEHSALAMQLSNRYSGSYEDQNSAINVTDGKRVAPNRVKAYSLWDMSASYKLNASLQLRVGIQNLLDTPPPYSNQAFFFISGYDPSYTDPRGRSAYVRAQYRF